MVHIPAKTSITKSEATTVVIKFAVSYVRVSSAKQSTDDKSGLRRQERDYVRWLQKNLEYKNLKMN